MEGFGLLDAAVGWVIGLATAFGGLWVYRHTAKRDAFQDHCSSYKERIAMREKEYEQEAEGTAKEDKRHSLSELRNEYDQFLEAWQQKQELAKLVPPTAITADKPKPSAEEIAQLVELLVGSDRLPASLLTAEDYFIRGNAYYEAGDYTQALEAYNRSLELLPDHPGTLNNRGLTLHELGRYEEALKDYSCAIQVTQGLPEVLFNRGNTLQEMKRYEEAIKSYTSALDLNPDYVKALINRGIALAKLERRGDALEDFNRALQLRLDDPDALMNRGVTLAHIGRYEEAIRDHDRAGQLRPDHPNSLYNRACTYSLMGKFEESLRDLKAAIKSDEKYCAEARTDEDFEKLRNNPEYGPRFRELLGE